MDLYFFCLISGIFTSHSPTISLTTLPCFFWNCINDFDGHTLNSSRLLLEPAKTEFKTRVFNFSSARINMRGSTLNMI